MDHEINKKPLEIIQENSADIFYFFDNNQVVNGQE
jgi:hypothetical protein